MIRALEYTGRPFIYIFEEFGRILIFLINAMSWMVRPPFRLRLVFKQMESVGVQSIFVVFITAVFTGMVLALQAFYGFRMFGGEGLVGATVALSMTREIGPVFTGLMVTARAGSAMATEIGTMRVTEQIDALYAMSINPVQYLVMPRLVAGVLMLPFLTIVADFIGIVGGYVAGVFLLNINPGIFMTRMVDMVNLGDIFNGLIKSACFGLILSLIGCYKGFNAGGGAEGVGKATTQTVVLSCVSILISDYFLTAFMFR